LINPSEKNIASKIECFEPPENQRNVFGKNVTGKMIEIINNIQQ